MQKQLKTEDRITIAQTLGEVIKSDCDISVLEIDFFNRVADSLQITPAELVGLEARPARKNKKAFSGKCC